MQHGAVEVVDKAGATPRVGSSSGCSTRVSPKTSTAVTVRVTSAHGRRRRTTSAMLAVSGPRLGSDILSRKLVVLLAVASGAAVANLYYAQPLLDVIAADLGVGGTRRGDRRHDLAAGLRGGDPALVPLGDMLDRRRLVTCLLLACAAALVCAALGRRSACWPWRSRRWACSASWRRWWSRWRARSPRARARPRGRDRDERPADRHPHRPHRRRPGGRAGRLATAVLAGRGDHARARVRLWRALPGGRATSRLPYRRLLGSVFGLVRDEPRLRRRMVYGACGMGTFSVLWTSLSLLLAEPPFGYSEAVIGLFGLAGIAGAAAAQVAGRLADAGRRHGATGAFWAAVALGWAALIAGEETVGLLLLGIVVLDLGVQGQHILNQSAIFAIDEETRSRLNTAYMANNFLWGALGSAAAAWAWSAHGWPLVCAIGAAFAVVALAMWVWESATSRGARGRGRPRGSSSAP